MIDLLSYFLRKRERGKKMFFNMNGGTSYCFIPYRVVSSVPNHFLSYFIPFLFFSFFLLIQRYKWNNGKISFFLFKSILIVLKFNKNIFFKYFLYKEKVLLLQDILQWIHFIWNGINTIDILNSWTEKRDEKICKRRWEWT